MADKLDWLNKHLILLRYLTIADVSAKEQYKIRPDLAELFTGVTGAEKMVFKLAALGRFKCAVELLAYLAHRRAGVWWVYRCVVSLYAELQEHPAVDRDIAEIGTNFTPVVPDFAKIQAPEPDPQNQANIDEGLAYMQAEYQRMRALADPETMQTFEEAREIAFKEFEKAQGIHPMALLKQIVEKMHQNPYEIDRNSPIFLEAAKLKAQLGAVQKETVETIKAVLPPKVPEHEKKVRDDALSAVYRWVVAPDEINSKKCLDIGNECPDTPAGLLALSAFWAFGNLMPGGEQIVPTPPGLAANGLCQVLLMCALHKGGVRKLKERYELYFNLGVDVLSGKDNWDESLAEGKAPHETLSGAAPAERAVEAPPGKGPGSTYKRWKPE